MIPLPAHYLVLTLAARGFAAPQAVTPALQANANGAQTKPIDEVNLDQWNSGDWISNFTGPGGDFSFRFSNNNSCANFDMGPYTYLNGTKTPKASWGDVKNDFQRYPRSVQSTNSTRNSVRLLIEPSQTQSNGILQRVQNSYNTSDSSQISSKLYPQLKSILDGMQIHIFFNATSPVFSIRNAKLQAGTTDTQSNPHDIAAALAVYVTSSATAMLNTYNQNDRSIRIVDLTMAAVAAKAFQVLLQYAESLTQPPSGDIPLSVNIDIAAIETSLRQIASGTLPKGLEIPKSFQSENEVESTAGNTVCDTNVRAGAKRESSLA